ncbi:hypothetical protein [Falsibacillus pallidus]|nr:hypothetical protein [Falsibacillus pallidus]
MIKSVNDNDEAVFMSYQNENNPIFYKEQKRWIEEAIFKKGQGSSLTVDFENFEKETDTTGTVTLKVDMTTPGNGSSTNYIKYQTIRVNDKWVLNDVPFEEMKSETENITVYYNQGEEEAAKKTLKDATDIVNYYKKKFSWNPGPLSIKLYPTPGEVSATVPWVSLAGWNEGGESIEITTELTKEIFRFLTHELTHKMLGDLTNDNASIYIQEGFASYLEISVYRDENGEVQFDPNRAKEMTTLSLKKKKSVKTIEELGNIDYTDPEGSMYRDGFLLFNYLIETNGLDKFFEMIHCLSKFDYIDKRGEHKMDKTQERTVEAIEKIYGPAGDVSSNCQAFYSK